jgi:putative transposase
MLCTLAITAERAGAVYPINWKSKYAGVAVSELKRMRELETENAKLKRMYAELAMENAAIKDVFKERLKNPRK